MAQRKLRLVDDNRLSALIRATRASNMLTQDQLAKRFGVKQQTIGAWERGSPPQARFHDAIADFIGLDGGEGAVKRLLSQSDLPGSTDVPDRPGLNAGPGSRPSHEATDPLEAVRLDARRSINRFVEEAGGRRLTDEEIAFFRELLNP